MPNTALEALQLANHNIGKRLTQLRCVGANVVHPDLLADLRVNLAETGVWIKRLPTDGPASPQLDAEISQYRSHLQELARILPTIHARLLAQRARMQTLGERYEAVQAWARAQQAAP